MIGIFISFFSLNGIIKKNEMLFDRYDILLLKCTKDIEQSLVSGMISSERTHTVQPCERQQKTVDFSLEQITY